MLSTQQRITQILMSAIQPDKLSERALHLTSELNSLTMTDFGISSVDILTQLKRIGDEFGIEISPEDAAGFVTLQDMVDHVERRA